MLKIWLFSALILMSGMSYGFDVNQTASEKPSVKTPSVEMQKAIDSMKQHQPENITSLDRIKKYVVSGFHHIIPKGLDHIVFITALFLSTTYLVQLFWQVSIFTLAHTITLALATVWGITLSASIVEPLIALSIVYVAVETIRKGETGKTSYLTTFIFGLLHGFGFAFVLVEFGLSSTNLATTLLAFNVGVELGQLSVITALLLAFFHWRKQPSYRMFVQIPLSALVAGLGMFWLLERII